VSEAGRSAAATEIAALMEEILAHLPPEAA